jgi:hypothetical protein
VTGAGTSGADHAGGRSDGERLGEKLLDLLIFIPTGAVMSVAEELPKLAARGRQRLGVPVSSARAMGELVVRFGEQELRRRSGRAPSPPTPPGDRRGPRPASRPVAVPDTGRSAPVVPEPGERPAGEATPRDREPTAAGPSTRPDHPARTPRPLNGNVPAVASLAIPGFDTLSASQVVQRLDGLSREELVAVRAYESSSRGRRTVLNRVDQLLEERA